MILNFILGIIGFISVIGIITGPIFGIVFLILWLTTKSGKKKNYKKTAIIFFGIFLAGFILNILTLVGYAVANTIGNTQNPSQAIIQDVNSSNK